MNILGKYITLQEIYCIEKQNPGKILHRKTLSRKILQWNYITQENKTQINISDKYNNTGMLLREKIKGRKNITQT